MDMIKAGTLVIFSEGQYSDYGYQGAFVALQDISQEVLKRCAVKASEKGDCPRKNGYWYDAKSKAKECVLGVLIREGYLLVLPYTEVYLGAYGAIDEETFGEVPEWED